MNEMKFVILVAVIAMTVMSAGCGDTGTPVAKIEEFSGKVEVKAGEAEELKAALNGHEIFSGGAVKSGEGAEALIQFVNDSTKITLSENTFFEVRNFTEKELSQMSGVAVYKISPQNRELKIHTPHGIATVLGTVFRMDVISTCTVLIVDEGTVGFTDSLKNVTVSAGNRFITGMDEKPEPVDPDDLNRLFSPEGKTRTYFNLR